jgi:hypothetical protein
MNTFKHSGDLGDIIYSLPTIRALGGGILYLDPEGGRSEAIVSATTPNKKTKLTKHTIDFISPLLKNQSYIKDVVYWNGERVNYNLDLFREVFINPNRRNKYGNLTDCHLQKFNLPWKESNKPWIDVKNKITLDRKIVISRTPRYQNNHSWLEARRSIFSESAVFIGLPKEHEYFEWTFDIKLPYYKTDSIIDLAEVINGCDTFIANQSFPLSLAIAMGHPKTIVELDQRVPSTFFDNKSIMYI